MLALIGMNRPNLSRLFKVSANGGAPSGWFVSGLLARFNWLKPSQDLCGSRLSHAEQELQQIAGVLENQFLATSNQLERLVQKGGQFVKESEKLVKAATGRAGDSTVFYDATRVLEMPLSFLNDCHAQSLEFLLGLKQDSQRIGELINTQTELQHTIAPLKYIQTLFKIESAPLGQEVQVMFGALTTEIEKLHDQISELFATKFFELREIQRTVNEVIKELQTQTDILQGIISKEKVQIDQSLCDLQRELDENQRRETRISRLSSEVNRQIQQVVTGLQYQDIINQKLQHTCLAIDEMKAHLGEANTGTLLASSCRLQTGQIQAIRRNLTDAEAAVRSGTEKILTHFVNADSQSVSLEEFQQLTTTSAGMTQVLSGVFATLRREISVTVTGTARACAKLRPACGLASGMTLVVRDLSRRIHIIGLNAQVQAALVEKGVGLEVLSARTSEISRATNQISENVAKQLDQLVAGLAASAKALEALHGEALKQQVFLNEEGGAKEQNFLALCAEAEAGVARVGTLLDGVRSESQAVIETLNYVGACDGILAGVQAELDAIVTVFGVARDSAEGNPHGFVDQLRHKYTMASERDVYDQVIGGQTTPAAAPPSEMDVEFFDLSAPSAAEPAETILTTPAVVPKVNAKSSWSLPPEPVDPAGGSVVAPETRPADLGKNVELF